MEGELNCKLCRKRVPVKEMKYNKDGSGLICSSCSNKEKQGISMNINSKPLQRPVNAEKKKVAYYCRSCNFRFARAIDFRGPRACPNCSKGTIIANLPNDADELLKALDQMDDV